MQNILYPVIFFALLILSLWVGWKVRGWVQRFENMEKVYQRKDIPNPLKAGLEDINALAGMDLFESGEDDKMLIGMMNMVILYSRRRNRTAWFSQEIERISAMLRENPRGYDPDAPLEKR